MSRIGWVVAIFLGSLITVSQASMHIALLGDRTGTANDVIFEQALRDIENLKPDLVINIGDLIEGPQPDAEAIDREWDHVLKQLDILSMPIHFVPGNNDIFNDVSRELYPQRTKVPPYYSFDVETTHFIVLDVSQIRNFENMAQEQVNWLVNDLDTHLSAPLTCVFLHKPFWLDAEQSGAFDAMHDLFVKKGVDWVFSGHYHNCVHTEKDGIDYMMIGSSGGHIGDNPERGEFYHFGWLMIDNDTVHCSIVRTGATERGDFLSVRELTAQNAIDEMLTSNFMLDAVLQTKDGEIPLSVTFNNPGEGSFEGNYKWEDEGSAWQLSPPTGIYSSSDSHVSMNFTARRRGTETYPLPRIAITCPLIGNKTYTSLQRPAIRQNSPIPSTSKAITLDGNLKEKAWKKASILSDFGAPDGTRSSVETTSVKMIHDETDLYVGIECLESKPGEMVVSGTGRDSAVFEGDCIFLIFWSGEPPENCTQIVMNSRGDILDQKGPIASSKQARPQLDPKWDGNISVKALHEKSTWSLEIRIPLTELDIPLPAQDRSVRFNLIRYQSRLQDSASWCWPATYSWEHAGILNFK